MPTKPAAVYMLAFHQRAWTWFLFYLSFSFFLNGIVQTLFGRSGLTHFGVGAFWISVPVAFLGLRRWALHQAWRDLLPDKSRYEERWRPIRESQGRDLEELALIVKDHNARHKVRQPSQNLLYLFDLASSSNAWYQQIVSSWAATLHVQHKAAPVKTQRRALQKVERSYKGDASRVLDFVRASVVVDTMAEVKRVLELVLSQAMVHKIKNRYETCFDGGATGGYRDLNLQISFKELQGTVFEGFVFELQIILAAILKVKSNDGHRRYIHCRNLRGD